MCLVTSKLKFCTCKATNVHRLKHYWILHRYNKHKNEMIVGEALLPLLFDFNYEENKISIVNRINDVDAFDFETDFKEKDHLEISLNTTLHEISESFVYCFKFQRGKWVLTDFDSFDLMSRFDELQFGKLKGIKK